MANSSYIGAAALLRDGGRSSVVRSGYAPVLLLLDQEVILRDEWDDLPLKVRDELTAAPDLDALLPALLRRNLLTRFQAGMIREGNGPLLTIGQYRLLEPLGRGGMGVVYRGEHRHLRRPVAVKVMAERASGNARLSSRFFTEARVVARLQHPNIVACLDAGWDLPRTPGAPARGYYVMDLVAGTDLAAAVAASGPLPVHRAADLFRQVAEALAEAHRFGLVHRDIKPSNVLVAAGDVAKVLDFGLVRHPASELTEPGVLIGSLGYMAPEQIRDASKVDPRADVFGLGASLFHALTGAEPFPVTGDAAACAARRLVAPVPRVRAARPELPAELDGLVAKLMDPNPDRRFPSAAAAAAALLPFAKWRPVAPAPAPRPRVLVVDDDPDVVAFVEAILTPEFECAAAGNGRAGLAAAGAGRFDLVLVDHEMPELDGVRLVSQLRQAAADPPPMVLFMSGRLPTEALGGLLLAGADDFVRKPFDAAELTSRVRGLLRRRAADAVPRPDRPAAPVARAEGVGLLAEGVARLLAEAGLHRPGYHARLARYVRALSQAVRPDGEYARLADPAFVDLLAAAAPAHDYGLLTVSQTTLLRPGRLDETERLAAEAHAQVGGEVLGALAAAHPDSPGLGLAAEIARHHHERWDGAGYPDGLAGARTPLAARVVGLAAVYDALRSRRPYRPALRHAQAVRVVTADSPGQFDPALVAGFAAAAELFDGIASPATS